MNRDCGVDVRRDALSRGVSPARPRVGGGVGLGCGLEGDGVAHGFELFDEASLPGVAVSSFLEVVTTEWSAAVILDRRGLCCLLV